jgi:hypothetical protein
MDAPSEGFNDESCWKRHGIGRQADLEVHKERAMFSDYFYCLEITGRIPFPQKLVLIEVEGD